MNFTFKVILNYKCLVIRNFELYLQLSQHALQSVHSSHLLEHPWINHFRHLLIQPRV